MGRVCNVYMHKTNCLFLILFLSFFLISGCASKGTLRIQSPVSIQVSKHKTLEIDVDSNVADIEAERVQLENVILKKMKIANIRSVEPFKDIYLEGTSLSNNTDLKLKVTVTEIRRVSAFARFMIGALAGQGKMIACIEVFDGKTDHLLGKGWAEGLSSGGSAFSGTTSEAIERVTGQVVKFIVNSTESPTS